MAVDDSLHRRSIWQQLWPAGLLALLTLVFHHRLLLSTSDEIIHAVDIRWYFYWLHTYAREELLAGRWPLWNPYNYCGVPFAANPQTTVFYPLSWIHLLMPVNQAEKYMIAMHVWLAGVFMFMYLRAVQLSKCASLLGATVYMFSGYMMANIAVGHLTVLFTAAWIPLAMYCAERAISRGGLSRFVALGLVMGVQILAGEPQSSYYTSLLLGVYVLVRILFPAEADRRSSSKLSSLLRGVAGLVLAAVTAAGLGAVQLLPAVEFGLNSDRLTPSYSFATVGSFPPGSVFNFIFPWSSDKVEGLGLNGTAFFAQQWWEQSGYVGIMTLILAGASWSMRGRRELWPVRVALVVAFVLMLGRFTPVYRILYEALPALSFFRIPSRALIIAQWALATMAAFGLDHLTVGEEKRWRTAPWRIAATAGIVGTLIALFGSLQIIGLHWVMAQQEHALANQLPASLVDGPLARAVICLIGTLAVIVSIGWLPRRIAALVILMTVIADLALSKPTVLLAPFKIDQEQGYSLLVSQRNDPNATVQPYRIDVPSWIAPANLAMAARVENVNGYAPLAVGRFFRYVYSMRGEEPSDTSRFQLPDRLYHSTNPFSLRILNIWYAAQWVAERNQYFPATDRRALPRAWIVNSAEVISDESATLARLKRPDFDPLHTVLLERQPQIAMSGSPPTSPGTVRVRRINPGSLEMETHSFRDGYLVLSEIYYPGWRARIDGVPVELERANSLITAMPLTAGRHIVSYRFEPLSVRIGAICTGIFAVLGTVTMIEAQLRKPRG